MTSTSDPPAKRGLKAVGNFPGTNIAMTDTQIKRAESVQLAIAEYGPINKRDLFAAASDQFNADGITEINFGTSFKVSKIHAKELTGYTVTFSRDTGLYTADPPTELMISDREIDMQEMLTRQRTIYLWTKAIPKYQRGRMFRDLLAKQHAALECLENAVGVPDGERVATPLGDLITNDA